MTPLRQVARVQARHRHHGARARRSPRSACAGAPRGSWAAGAAHAGVPLRPRVAARDGRRRRLRPRVHPGRPLPHHPRASLRSTPAAPTAQARHHGSHDADDVHSPITARRPANEDPRHDQAGARHGDPGEDRRRRPRDRHRRHHVDRVALRRVRGRGGAAHQGEARPGRGRRRVARSRPRQGGAPLLPGHGRGPRHPPERPRLGRRRHPGHRRARSPR